MSLGAKPFICEFDFQENEHEGQRHFHVNGFTQGLVLTQRQKTTRKWRVGQLLQFLQ